MNTETAMAFNAGIEAAVKEYKNGIGAIMALKKKFVVTVDHVSPYCTRQDVRVENE